MEPNRGPLRRRIFGGCHEVHVACKAPALLLRARNSREPSGSGDRRRRLSELGKRCPIRSSSFGNEYQQIYTATAFPGSFSIGSIDFFHTQFDVGSGIFATGTYNIFLGTTSRAITAIDPIFANNETTPLVPFATLMIAPGTSAAAPTFTIVGIPFVYNPSLGNLLLDIQYSTTSGALFLDFDRDANGVMSRVFGSGGSGTVTTAWVSLRDSTGSSPLSRRRPC